MHHEHRGFGAADPESARAVDDARPIIAALNHERAKPQPKNVDHLRAWRSHIEDLRDTLALIARRIDIPPTELEELAAVGTDRRAAAPARTVTPEPPARPPISLPSFGDLATEMSVLGTRVAEIATDQKRLFEEERRLLIRMNIVRKLLYPHGRRRMSR